MAITGSTIPVEVPSSSNSMEGRITWSYTQDDSANTSMVTAILQYRTQTGPTTSYSGANVSNFYLTIEDSTVTKTNGATIARADGWVTILTLEKTVAHNSDGTKSITISAGGGIPATAGLPNSNGSGTHSLQQIPRGSKFGDISGSSIGARLTIGVTVPTGVTNYHRIAYSFKGKTTITGDVTTSPYTSSSSYSWTPAYGTFGAAIPDRTTGTLTLTLTSYMDAACTTQRGDPDTTTLTLTMPNNASTKPTMGTVSATDTTYARDPSNTKVVTLIGSYVQGVSKPQFTTTAAEGKYGATITSYSFTFENVTKSGTALSQSFGVVQGTGSVRCVITATDSRGYTNTKNRDINVLAYTFPAIKAQRIKRTATDTVTATASATTTDLGDNRNALQIFVSYKLPSESYYHNETELTGGTTTRADGVKTLTNASAALSNVSDSLSYNFRITVKDSLTTYSQDYKIGTSAVGLHIGPTWVGVGKIREHGTLDVGGAIYTSDTIHSANTIFAENNGKTGSADGLQGSAIGRNGRIYLTGGDGVLPGIYFYQNGDTSTTTYLYATSDGIRIGGEKFFSGNTPCSVGKYADASNTTYQIDLVSGRPLLLMIDQITSASDTRHGVYYIWSYKTSGGEYRNVSIPLHDAPDVANISFSGNTVIVTSLLQYVRVTGVAPYGSVNVTIE